VHPEAQHELEFIASERVDSRDWSQEPFVCAEMRTNISGPLVEWSDNEDGEDEPEDRRTSSPDANTRTGASRDGISQTL